MHATYMVWFWHNPAEPERAERSAENQAGRAAWMAAFSNFCFHSGQSSIGQVW